MKEGALKIMHKRNILIPFLILISSCQFLPSSKSGTNSEIFNSSNSTHINIDEDLWDLSQNDLRKNSRTFELYNLNDFHGTTELSSSEPGINRLSTYFKKQKQIANDNNKTFILTSSGDMWQGSADSNITKGRLVVDWMNLLGFEAMAFGNHEFDWTIDTIKDNQNRANFPFLACNILNKSDHQLADFTSPYTTITRDGLRIGIIGAIGEGLTSSILASNVKDLTFARPGPIVDKYAKYLKDNGADIVLYLFHSSSDQVIYDAQYMSYVDMAFLGHTHSFENVNNPIPMLQGSCNGKGISHFSFSYDFNDNKIIKSSFIQETIYSDSIISSYTQEDQETKVIYDQYLNEENNEVKNEVVGYTAYDIDRNTLVNNLLVYMNSYYEDELKIQCDNLDILAVEHNNARSNISSGYITYGSIYKAFPFDNSLCLVKTKYSFFNNSEYGFKSYASGQFYYPDIEKIYDDNDDVYILTIDYVATYANYDGYVEILYQFFDTFPRDIFKMYCHNDYPINN